MFVKMNLGDAVVIEINGLANSILRDFEPAVQISSKCCSEVESEQEAEGMFLQLLEKFRPMGRFPQNCE